MLNKLPLFVRRAAIAFPIQIGGTLLQFGTAIFMARTLGVSEYGAYVYAFTWATILALFIGMGADQVNIREIPRLVRDHKRNELSGLFLTTLCMMAGISVLIFSILMLLEKTETVLFSLDASLIVAVAITIALVGFLVSLNQAFQKILFSQVIGRLGMPSLYILALLVFFFLFDNLNAGRALTLYVLSGCVILLLLAVSVKKENILQINTSGASKIGIVALLKSSIPLAFVSFTYLINSSADIIIIGLYLEDSDVGVYRVANRGAAFIGLILVIVNQILMPMLSQSIAKGDHPGAQKLVSLASALLLGLGIIAGLVMFFGSLLFLGIFGPDFAVGETALKFLIIGSLADVFSGTVGAILILNKHESAILKINLFGIILNVVLNLLLITDYGINGAAIATAVAMCLTRLLMVIYVIRKTAFDPLFFIPWFR